MGNNEIVPGFDDMVDPELVIRLQKVDGIDKCLVLHLEGGIHRYSSAGFHDKVFVAIEAGYLRLIFDLERLRGWEDFNPSVFFKFQQTVKPQGGDVILSNVQPDFKGVFDLFGMDKFFIFKDTIEQATSFFVE